MRRVCIAIIAASSYLTSAAFAQAPVPGIANSDQYGIHGPKFEAVARELIAKGRCKEADFKELGGFWRSTDVSRPGQYFTYCGGMNLNNKIYVRMLADRAELTN